VIDAARQTILPSSRPWDAVVVGSGFGGSMAARELVRAGMRVLLLERGDWVEKGPHDEAWAVPWKVRPGYSLKDPYVIDGGPSRAVGTFECVGGMSVFYGGVSLRMRAEDFRGSPEVTGDVRWPLEYGDLEPWYAAAEALLGVAGDEASDATAPPRSRPLAHPREPWSPTSAALARAAMRLQLHPFRIPMAARGSSDDGTSSCAFSGACDGFACAGKRDLATAVLPRLIEAGLTLRPNSVVCRLETEGRRVRAALGVDRLTGEPFRIEAERFVVAAGALATPHLLLVSKLERLSPAGDTVGRYLMRHCNGIVLGAASTSLGEVGDMRKQLAVHDLYLGDDRQSEVTGKLGAIQQLRAVHIALSMAPLPRSLKQAIYPAVSRLLGFIVMAEDQPDPHNRVYLDAARQDCYGRRAARVHHRHTPRDHRARRALARRAAEILREANAVFTFTLPVRTFSHALGTVRMGHDRERFPVTPDGRFRGLGNLWITDASVFPTAGGVNPSLTIAANALRIASGIASGVAGDRSPARSIPWSVRPSTPRDRVPSGRATPRAPAAR